MTSMKTQNYECCMCGDHGLSHELFRCKVCHFRSQHRYCSNLYPKAESYRVCNWCLIQNNNKNNISSTTPTTTTTTTPTPISKNNSSPNNTSSKTSKSYNHLGGPKSGPGPKGLQPTSPIKKPMMRSQEGQLFSEGKRISTVHPPTKDDRLRRTKSFDEMSNNYSRSSSISRTSSSLGVGGPHVVKHVFRSKVRRYKLLDEVSS